MGDRNYNLYTAGQRYIIFFIYKTRERHNCFTVQSYTLSWSYGERIEADTICIIALYTYCFVQLYINCVEICKLAV